ncbi:type III-A CRISPR-associated RAMP protein Csm5 [Chloroflexi bacterium TSY]|nr:type III-A CRISPR-associated RAMP protein Csm5 [Chloroflexi bacterium TSY]
MTLKTIFDVTMSLLTPVHIGSGKELLHEYDYVIHGGKTWVMDSDAFLEAIYWRDGNPDERILGRPASELLERADFHEQSDYFRYIVAGRPRSQQPGAALVEQYKDIHDRPYLPGTSIKGALRTVLAWHGFQETGQLLSVRELRGNRSWAGQSIERELFGQDPNHDLLRGLQVADSDVQSSDRLQIVNAQVVTGSEKMGAPIEMEAIRSDTVFTTTFTIDRYLQRAEVQSKLQFGQRRKWLTELPQIAQRHTLERVREERDWYQRRKYGQVAGFYQQLVTILERQRLSSDQFLMQIGWGGGWPSKTIGAPLQRDREQWERLLGHKRLSPARMRRRQGDEFPKSRRAIVAQGQPVAPLGWCLIEIKQRK